MLEHCIMEQIQWSGTFGAYAIIILIMMAPIPGNTLRKKHTSWTKLGVYEKLYEMYVDIYSDNYSDIEYYVPTKVGAIKQILKFYRLILLL